MEIDVVIIEVGGGRAGVHEYDFANAGYNLDQLESLRQQLLRRNDIGQVQKAMQQLGIKVARNILHAVKRYNFDSQGIGFRYDNYTSWRRLATGSGTIGDAAYLVHEIAEVEELQRIQRQTGFDFMGRNVDALPRSKRLQWPSDFDRYYNEAHSKALSAEYEFVAEQVNRYINDRKLKLTKLQAAAIDPTRRIKPSAKETEAAEHMFVNGIIMRNHHHYDAWYRRANELLSLSKALQQRLEYYAQEVKLERLIELVKNRPIK